MKIDLNPQLKPLVANLLRIKIGHYLKTNNFNLLVLEHNFDDLWEQSKKIVKDRSVIIIGYDPITDYEEAFQLTINTLFTKNKKDFFDILELTLTNFIGWSNKQTDLSKVIENTKYKSSIFK